MASFENGRFSPRLESVIGRWCEEVTEAQTALTRQIAEGRAQLVRLAELLAADGENGQPDGHAFHAQVSGLQQELERQERRAAEAERRLETLSEERVKLADEVARLRERHQGEGLSPVQRQRERALEKEIRRARTRIASLEESAALQSSQYETLSCSLKAAEAEVSRLQNEATTLLAAQAQGEGEKAELRAEFEWVWAEAQRAASTLRQAQDAMEEHQRTEALQEAALRRANGETSRLKEEIQQLACERQAMRDAHAHALTQWDQQWTLLETSVDEVRAELQEVGKYAARLRLELQRAQSATDVLEADKAQLESEMAEAQRQLRELHQDKDVVVTERDALRGELREAGERAARLGHELHQAQSVADTLGTEKAQLESEMTEVQRRLSELHQDKDVVVTERDALRGELREAGERAARLRHELHQAQSEADALGAEKTRLDAEVAEIQRQLSEVHQDNDVMVTERDALRGELRKIGEEAARLRQELQRAQSEADALGAEKARLDAEMAEAQRRMCEMQEGKDVLATERDALRAGLTIEKEAHATARSSRAQLLQEVRQIRGQAEAFCRENQELRREAGEANQRTEEARRKLNAVAQELRHTRSSLQEALGKNEVLEAECARQIRRDEELQAQLTSLSEEWSASLAEIAALEQALERTRGEIAPLQIQLAKRDTQLHAERGVFEAKKAAVERALEQVRGEIAPLRLQLAERDTQLRVERESFEAEKGALSRGLEQTRREIGPLKTQLAEREAELRALRERAARWEQDLERAGGHWVAQRGVLTRELELFRSRLLTDAVFFLEPLTEELENLQLRQEAVGTLLEGLQRNAAQADGQARARRAGESLQPEPVSQEDFPENVRPLGFSNESAKVRLRQASV